MKCHRVEGVSFRQWPSKAFLYREIWKKGLEANEAASRVDIPGGRVFQVVRTVSETTPRQESLAYLKDDKEAIEVELE